MSSALQIVLTTMLDSSATVTAVILSLDMELPSTTCDAETQARAYSSRYAASRTHQHHERRPQTGMC